MSKSPARNLGVCVGSRLDADLVLEQGADR
jgi:hypothetical protein